MKLGKNYLFVGVDPGTTTGVALLGLDGDLISVESRRSWGFDKVIDFIVGHGIPSVIAADVDHAPSFVAKVATSFGVPLVHPPENLSTEFKQDITRGLEFGDAHQMDALAAALFAQRKNRNKIRRLRKTGEEDEVIHLVLQGNRADKAKRIIREAMPRKKQANAPEKPAAKPSPPVKRLSRVEKDLVDCRRMLEEAAGEATLWREKYYKLRRESNLGLSEKKKIQSRETTIKNLKKRLKKAGGENRGLRSLKKKLEEVSEGALILVPRYPKVNRGLTIVRGIPDSFDYDKVKTVFTDSEKSLKKLRREHVEAYPLKNLEENAGMHFISREELERVRGKKVSLKKIVEEYRER